MCTDGDINGSYEPLYIPDTIQVELFWNGKTISEQPNHELFKPIELGQFVMKEKKEEI